MRPPVAWYREFLPCQALQADVYVLFSFGLRASAAPPFLGLPIADVIERAGSARWRA